MNPIDYWYQKYLKEKLTWEDVMLFRLLFDTADANQALGALKVQPMTREYYEFILQEFYKKKMG